MLTIGATLSIFVMLGISSLALFWAKRIRLPHTVLLVIIGIVLGLLSYIPAFSFIGEFNLTPELLFYLLLPTLIFESAYNINARRMIDDVPIILTLSVIGLLVSTLVIAGLLYALLTFFGVTIPFMVVLLFGALISATDPVAVLALFKEYGAPRRLSLIFEGESLFNDATAVALFLVLLEVTLTDFHGASTIIEGTVTFLSMLIGGTLFGIITGGLFAKVVGYTKESEIASITLTIVLAHTTFILAEVISHHLNFGGFHFALSPIIATTVAALLMGNYGRSKINPRAEEFVGKLWEQLAFWANSLIFILIGILFISIPHLEWSMVTIIFLTILVVAIARAASIYPVVMFFNAFSAPHHHIPTSWQHLLSWGSLRGALAVTMVLLIPDTLSFSNWPLAIAPKEFLLSLTIGCVAATLFIKATTIRSFIRHFKLDSLTAVEEIEYQEARALIHHQVTDQLIKYERRGYIDSAIADNLQKEHSAAFKKACNQITILSSERREDLAFRVLRMYAIGIERRHLKMLYDHQEVTESVFRRIQGKLQLQLEAIENGNLSPDVTIHVDSRDVFERCFRLLKIALGGNDDKYTFAERYMYYRAQSIISRKVIKELTVLEQVSKTIFTPEAVRHVHELYTSFRQNSEQKLKNLSAEDNRQTELLAESLANHGVHTIEEGVLEDIYRKELITPKLYITLKEELRVSGK